MWACKECAADMGAPHREGRFGSPYGFCAVGQHHVKTRVEYLGPIDHDREKADNNGSSSKQARRETPPADA